MTALPHAREPLANGLFFESGHLASIAPKRVTQFTLCPSCGSCMGAVPNSDVFECKECRVLVTQPTRL
jgi:tRNA(Ile2) C34 agmatinyltransferase TiaS